MPDLIDHKKTGYLAAPFDTTDLSEDIRFALGNVSKGDSMSKCCVQKANVDYELSKVASRYKALYEDLL